MAKLWFMFPTGNWNRIDSIAFTVERANSKSSLCWEMVFISVRLGEFSSTVPLDKPFVSVVNTYVRLSTTIRLGWSLFSTTNLNQLKWKRESLSRTVIVNEDVNTRLFQSFKSLLSIKPSSRSSWKILSLNWGFQSFFIEVGDFFLLPQNFSIYFFFSFPKFPIII